jgi:ubiquinone/menaquinone biosynthesis C-methylase UbiE/uncharacterized protein YbaR (Trm112 family)
MKYRLPDLLKDPEDGTQLRVENPRVQSVPFSCRLDKVKCSRFCALKNCAVPEANVTPGDCMHCFTQEIIEGELVSERGNRYPIKGGIPRILSRQTAGWLKKNQATFSLEWKMFRFGENNWGQDITFRKNLFLKGLGVDAFELKGRRILDAGCGSGLLAMEFGNSFGMEVIALDLAFGIEQAYVFNKNPFVYFIQASVLEAPVREAAVDYLYCAGVLVHVEDARHGFKQLKPVLKPGGRFFVWMYHPIDNAHHPKDMRKMHLYNWIRGRITSRLPILIQYIIYLSVIPLYLLKRTVCNAVKREKNKTTWREKMQDLTDMFSAYYQHRFTEAEILRWYEEEGFVNATTAYTEAYGFGSRGDLPASNERVKTKDEIPGHLFPASLGVREN